MIFEDLQFYSSNIRSETLPLTQQEEKTGKEENVPHSPYYKNLPATFPTTPHPTPKMVQHTGKCKVLEIIVSSSIRSFLALFTAQALYEESSFHF